MTDFMAIWEGRSEIHEELTRRREEQEARREAELGACTCVQRIYRGKQVREEVGHKRAACVEIQRSFRGWRGRGKASEVQQGRREKENLAIYHYHALVIQCAYHGYISRKYNYDHRKRQMYLRGIADVGNNMRDTLRQYNMELQEQQAKTQQEEFLNGVKKVTRNLHHLLSTASSAGVFNSPYAQDQLPTISGLPVEMHITANVKELLRTRGYTKRGLEKDMNGTQRSKAILPESRRSVQAQTPYAQDKARQDQEKALHRLKMVGPREFNAGNKVPLPAYKRGVAEGSEYMESWRNPFLVRGVPHDQQELTKPLSQTTLGKFPSKPFYTSVGGNKSSVLPNNRFDVILEAEQSGGVVQRHLGTSGRFGVPDTCDVK